MSFCPRCGGRLEEKQQETETRPRLICSDCGFIFYLNPKVVAATLPLKEGRVFLLRRGIEPRHGTWTFPAGFMEVDETAEQAALRETKEETNLEVTITALLGVYSRPSVGIVVVVYLAEVVGGEPQLGPETLEVASFAPKELPWDDLAFETTTWALQDWVVLMGGSGS